MEEKEKKEDISKNIAKLMAKKYSSYMQGNAPKLEYVPSGLAGVDWLLGGGLPCGRIIEMFADPSVGKTTTAQFFIKQLIELGYDTALIDAERTVSEKRLKDLDLGGNKFHYSRPSSGSQAIEQIIDLANLGVKLIVLDSVPFLVTDEAQEADAGQIVMSPQARLLSRVQPKLIPAIEENGCILIFLNQIRSQIGRYGNPNQSSGGNALKFMCSVRLRLSRLETSSDGSGFSIKFKTEKNKASGREKQTCVVDIKHGQGLIAVSSLRELLSDLNLTFNRGSWFFFSDKLCSDLQFETNKIGQGKPAIDSFLLSDNSIYEKLYNYAVNYVEEVE